MTRTWTLLALTAALISLTGCPTGSADLIESLQIETTTLAAGTSVAVEVLLTEDGADAAIDWEVVGGGMSAMDAPAVRFIAGDEPGTATITVNATTSAGTDSATAEVTVVGWSVEDDLAGLELLLPSDEVPFNSVSFASPDVGWAVAGGEGYFDKPIIIRFDGNEWTDQTQGQQGHLHSAWANAEDDFFATGGGGLTYHWDGDDWTEFLIPGGCVHGLSFLDAGDGWVTPAEGQPYMRRHTEGDAWDWESYTAPASYGMNGVSMVTEDFGFAVGNGGRIFEFDGDEWVDVDSPTDESLHNISMLSDVKGWAVGDGGTILSWDGTAWEEMDSGSSKDLHGIQALGSDSVWVVGEDGKLLFFGGDEWVGLESPTEAPLKGIFMFDAGSGWVVGHEGTVLQLG
jgi:hypothetical protein